MSFTTKIKDELCDAALARQAQKTVLHGFLYTLRDGGEFYTESSGVAAFVAALAGKANSEIIIKRKKKADGYCVHFEKAFINLSKSHTNDTDELKKIMNGSDTQTGYFLRGVFLACGIVADPNKEYHLEIAVNDDEKCEQIFTLTKQIGMKLKKSARKGQVFLYTKESESISDFLTFIGAMISSMEIMNVKIYKDIRNNVNRAVNCEAANIEKTVAAGRKQIEDINYIIMKKGIQALPEELREVARIRCNNIEMSLREIGELVEPKISRSGVNHRLRRISDIAENLRKEE